MDKLVRFAHNWNVGILEYWKNGFWPPACRAYGSERKMGEWFIRQAILTKHEANEKIVVILSLLRRFYIIPLFHVQGINSDSAKTFLFSISCTNSET